MGGSTGYGGVRRQWSAASVMAARQEGAAAASDGACANLVAVDPASSGADGPADSKGTRQRGSRGGGNGKGKRQRQKLQHRLASAHTHSSLSDARVSPRAGTKSRSPTPRPADPPRMAVAAGREAGGRQLALIALGRSDTLTGELTHQVIIDHTGSGRPHVVPPR